LIFLFVFNSTKKNIFRRQEKQERTLDWLD